MSITMQELAKIANVSSSTISRVINNPEMVSEKTVNRIRKIMDEYNFVPNSVARSLVIKSTNNIGVVVADIMNPFYSEMIRAIQDESDSLGYSVISCNSDENFEKEKKCIAMLKEKQVDGIILAGGRSKVNKYNEHLFTLAKNIPVVLADEYIEGENIYCIVCDKKQGAYDAVKYFISLGHKNIGVVNGRQGFRPSIEKLEGYKLALEEASISYRKELVVSGEYNINGGIEGVHKLMKVENPPTAILCANDLIAVGAIYALQNLGHIVPEDVSVIGFDDINTNEYVSPALSSVSQHIRTIGTQSARLMIEILQGKKNLPQKIVIPASLIIRKS